HGAGNDFIMVENVHDQQHFQSEEVAKLCNRNFGIGADGFIAIEPGRKGGDIFMNYFNADGSVAEMCGNGARCSAHFAVKVMGYSGKSLQLETRAGIKQIDVLDNPENYFRVNMGSPVFHHSDFPANAQSFEGTKFNFASMGNPHAVGFFNSEEEVDQKIYSLGSLLESDTGNFPNKVNVNFLYKKDDNHFGVKTYERGCGPTLACGTGASASFAVLTDILSLASKTDTVQIDVPGGTLYFQYNEAGEILMSGPSEFVFQGTI
ncbi:MAG: diaminopimelate epimerase, partial [Candidatus Peregrinibacteria bacterium]|nr:diaminopimelate epimerase [Candidatus Peregrinibacteria bacterium]